jgi:hypothetical protein
MSRVIRGIIRRGPRGVVGQVSEAELAAAVAVESTARAVADALLLPKAGGTMTGKIVLDGDPTLALHAATRQYVLDRIDALISAAPGTLDTLEEIAALLEDDANLATALANALAAETADRIDGDEGLGERIDEIADGDPLVSPSLQEATGRLKVVAVFKFGLRDDEPYYNLDGAALDETARLEFSDTGAPYLTPIGA